jgi:hypothetical protein
VIFANTTRLSGALFLSNQQPPEYATENANGTKAAIAALLTL